MAKKTAEKVDKARVVKGRFVRVKNTDKKKFSSANEEYMAIWVENADGKSERCLLFTDDQIQEAEFRASRNKEDLTKKGFLADLFD